MEIYFNVSYSPTETWKSSVVAAKVRFNADWFFVSRCQNYPDWSRASKTDKSWYATRLLYATKTTNVRSNERRKQLPRLRKIALVRVSKTLAFVCNLTCSYGSSFQKTTVLDFSYNRIVRLLLVLIITILGNAFFSYIYQSGVSFRKYNRSRVR